MRTLALCAIASFTLLLGYSAHAQEIARLTADGLAVSLHSNAPAEFELAVKADRPSAGKPPEVLLLHSPLRLVLDVPHTGFGSVRELPLNSSQLIALRIGTEPERSRIVVELEGSAAPTYSIEGSDPLQGIKMSFALPMRAANPAPVADEKPLPEAGPSAGVHVGAYTVHNDEVRMVPIRNQKTLSKIVEPEERKTSAGTRPPVLANAFNEELELRRKEISNLMEGRLNYGHDDATVQPIAPSPVPVSKRFTPPRRASTLPLAFAGTAIVLACSLLAILVRRQLRENFAETEYYVDPGPRLADNERARMEQLRREKRLAECYAILGVREGGSSEEIKNRYKHLAKVFHEDKLTSQDLPDEMLQLASERFKSIQNAYETLKKEKNFN